MPKKNPAAVALGKKRWAGTTKAERSDAARKAAKARHDATPPEERAEKMRQAVKERWRKYRARKGLGKAKK